jgi:hypothetical protein
MKAADHRVRFGSGIENYEMNGRLIVCFRQELPIHSDDIYVRF